MAVTNLSRPSATLPYEGRDQATRVATGATILAPLILPAGAAGWG